MRIHTTRACAGLARVRLEVERARAIVDRMMRPRGSRPYGRRRHARRAGRFAAILWPVRGSGLCSSERRTGQPHGPPRCWMPWYKRGIYRNDEAPTLPARSRQTFVTRDTHATRIATRTPRPAAHAASVLCRPRSRFSLPHSESVLMSSGENAPSHRCMQASRAHARFIICERTLAHAHTTWHSSSG